MYCNLQKSPIMFNLKRQKTTSLMSTYCTVFYVLYVSKHIFSLGKWT